MKVKSLLAATLGLALALSALTGVALAGKPDDPGKSEQAPGQVKKAEQAPEQAPAAKAKPAKAKAKSKPAKVKPARTKGKSEAKTSGSYKETSQGTDLEHGMDHKHTICHATGSESNPYVVITPSVSGVFNGHIGHQNGEDIIPPFVYKGQTYSQNWDAAGQALFANGCEAPEEEQQVVQGSDKEKLTICHLTSSETNPFVVIEIASAAWPAHEAHGDKILKTGDNPAEICAPAQQQVSDEEAKQEAAAPQQQPAAPQDQGGVLGAQAEVRQPAQEGRGGVLGRIGAVAQNELPFTGLPLWIAVLAGAALIGAGVGVRKSIR